VQMLFKRMELILGMKSDLRRSRWPAGNPDNGTDCHAAQKAKLSPTNWIHSRWKGSNHTVAVWVVRPTTGAVVRVVVTTSQIFLAETDRFDTKKFDPWRQKTIYEHTRRDIPDTYELPLPPF